MSDAHGGNIFNTGEKYNLPLKKIIDYSVNINPFGIERGIKRIIKQSLKLIHNYPDINYKKLNEKIGEFYNTYSKNILAGNGSADLIYLIAGIIKPENALIIQPNFSEYERSLKIINCKVNYVIGREENNFKVPVEEIINAINKNNIVYLSNPNNPSGYYYSREELIDLLKFCKKSGCLLLVDEVFLDFLKEYEGITLVNLVNGYDNLFILKSFTKIFSLPGIRLGACIAHERNISKIKIKAVPWSINCIAQAIGEKIMDIDPEFIIKTRNYIKSEHNRLSRKLSGIKEIKIFRSYANYILCKILNNSNADELKDFLAKNYFLIRNCSNYPGLSNKYFRIAIKKNHENDKLLKLLIKFFS